YNFTWNIASAAPGPHTLSAVARDAAGNRATSAVVNVTVSSTNSTPPATNDVLWVDDALPAGAVPGADGGDAWTWVGSNPAPFSGPLASQSSIGASLHQHYFDWATATLAVQTGDVLVAYVYLDPTNLPAELMLQWNDGSWEHRAYWGA